MSCEVNKFPIKWLNGGFGFGSNFGADCIPYVNRKLFLRHGLKPTQMELVQDADFFVEEPNWDEGDELCDSILMGFVHEDSFEDNFCFQAGLRIELPAKNSGFDPLSEMEKVCSQPNIEAPKSDLALVDTSTGCFDMFGIGKMEEESYFMEVVDFFMMRMLLFFKVISAAHPNTHWELVYTGTTTLKFELTKYPSFFPEPYAGTIFWGVDEKGYFSDTFLKHYEMVLN